MNPVALEIHKNHENIQKTNIQYSLNLSGKSSIPQTTVHIVHKCNFDLKRIIFCQLSIDVDKLDTTCHVGPISAE